MSTSRRKFFAGAAGAVTAVTGTSLLGAETAAAVVTSTTQAQPPRISNILLSCKYGMTKGETIEERFQSVKDAGFDGIDFDDCGKYTAEQVRQASYNTGVFVHSAIDHTHWTKRFTSKNDAHVAQAQKNLEHCIRVSHAAGGSGVLLVIGMQADGRGEEQEEFLARTRENISKLLPLAGALGQPILFENVWNGMFYDGKGGPDQDCQGLIDFIDSFNSPLIGSYLDIGNHHRYANMGSWIRTLNKRILKLDLKGYDKSKTKWRDITEGDIDWADIRKALTEINFNGWATAEVGGGNTARLKKVCDQMKKALIG